ncbi:mannose receptor [Plakobranchus ocellatus]|uniref:Mannose receptor n=1 Tax=Plakobranchus ocellatus TaxID=259542 RepID=A0AAV4B9K9_9GAST|nr:mannose receptor [Plakobranchus ocellatus]
MALMFFLIFIGLSSEVLSAAVLNRKSLCPQNVLDKYEDSLLVTQEACYLFEANHRISYWNAVKQCRKDGGTLVSIADRKENYLIIKKLQELRMRNKFWIGLYRPMPKEGVESQKFLWLDRSDTSFTFWQNEKGKEGKKQRCVFMDANQAGRWADSGCWCEASTCPGYICKYVPKDEEPSTTVKTTPADTTPDQPAGGQITDTTAPAPPSGDKDDQECNFSCPDLSCGMNGYKYDKDTGCQVCECNE